MEDILIYRFYHGLYITTRQLDSTYSEEVCREMNIIHPPEEYDDINNILVGDLSPLNGISILAEGNSESVRLLMCRHLNSFRYSGVNIVFLKRKSESLDVNRWMWLNGTCFSVTKNDRLKALSDAVYAIHTSPFRAGECPLSEKEVTILECMLLGYNQKEVSGLMCRSEKTLSTQKLSARQKLKAGNDVSLIFNYLEMTRRLSSYSRIIS